MDADPLVLWGMYRPGMEKRACSCFTLQPLHLPGLEDIPGKPGKLCVCRPVVTIDLK